MPTIDVAMARSLRGGVLETVKNSLVRSIAANLARRDLVNDAEGKVHDVKTAFSSWDNCMQAAYCKWPVIGIIVVGSLIIFSIVWCVIRCCCCGVSCCCGCCQCLKCCGDCCGACDPPGTRNKHKHLDDPYPPQPNHGYRSEAPMDSGISPFAPRANHATVPQFAEFETSKKGAGEDSLPAMPSWETSATKKVLVHEEEMEMNNLQKSPVPEQQVGVMNNTPAARMSPLPRGQSPYGQRPGNQSPHLGGNQSPYQGGHVSPDPYSPLDHGHGYNSNTNLNAYGNNNMNNYGDRNGNGYGNNHVDNYGSNNMNSYGNISANGYGDNHTKGYGDNHVNSYGDNHANGYGENHANGYGVNNSYANRTPAPAEMSSEKDTPVELQGSDSYGQTTYVEAPAEPVYPQSRTPHNDNLSQNDFRRPTPGPMYGTDPRMRQSPGPNQDPYGYGQSARRTPGPPNDYAARRTPAPDFGFDRAFSPAPDRQYGAASPRPEARPVPHRVYGNEAPQTPITNSSGFDFNSGHSRPSPSPTTEAYPGYKAYQPS